MCPMCIGTATLVLSGGGGAGGSALLVGFLARRKSWLRLPRFFRRRRSGQPSRATCTGAKY